MNDIIVGMGEALWDVLPEGKKIRRCSGKLLLTMYRNSVSTAALVSAVGEDKWVMRY